MQTLLAIILGLIISVVANLFIEGARYFLSAIFRDNVVRVGNIDINLLPTVAMVLSAILILTVRKLLGVTKWSGPADSIYALHQQKVGVDVRVGIGSTLAASYPLVASLRWAIRPSCPLRGNTSNRTFTYSGLQISKDVLLACGVAAAISAGFNAPIAGIIFAHEALLRRFSIGAVAPISVASIVASASNHYFGFANLAFEVPLANLELIEVVPFLIVFAPICSAVAIIYMLALRQGTQFAASGRYYNHDFFDSASRGNYWRLFARRFGFGLYSDQPDGQWAVRANISDPFISSKDSCHRRLHRVWLFWGGLRSSFICGSRTWRHFIRLTHSGRPAK